MNVTLKESVKYILRSRLLISKEISHVEWLYSLSDDELYDYKERQFLNLFGRAYRHSSFYREFYRNKGIEENDIRRLEDITKLPVLTKNIIKNSSESMLTLPRQLVFKANTSGTTGTPLSVYHSYKAIRLEQAYNWVRRRRYGFTYGEKLASLRGNLGVNQFSAYIPVSNTLYLSSYQISDSLAQEYHSAIGKFKPKAIEGYPSSLYNLALALRRKGLSFDIPLAFTSSETLFPFQRSMIEEVFGTVVFDMYGCTERSVCFSERCQHNGYYEEPGYCHTELFDDHIVTTSFINHVFPLIRYRVDDVLRADMSGNIISIDGRNEDVVICKDGVKVGRLDHIIKGVEGVAIAQIIQRVPGEIEINYVPDDLFSDSIICEIEDRLYHRIAKNNIDVVFSMVDRDSIEYTGRNKFSFVKSYLS